MGADHDCFVTTRRLPLSKIQLPTCYLSTRNRAPRLASHYPPAQRLRYLRLKPRAAQRVVAIGRLPNLRDLLFIDVRLE